MAEEAERIARIQAENRASIPQETLDFEEKQRLEEAAKVKTMAKNHCGICGYSLFEVTVWEDRYETWITCSRCGYTVCVHSG